VLTRQAAQDNLERRCTDNNGPMLCVAPQGDWLATHGGVFNTLAADIVEASGWPYLDTWNATVRWRSNGVKYLVRRPAAFAAAACRGQN